MSQLISWDADDYDGTFCEDDTYGLVNAAFCPLDNTIGWDRGVLLPALRRANGDMAITMVLAHEYGHSVQKQAKLNKRGTPTLVGRAAGRLLRRRLHALGGRGQLAAVHAVDRRRAEQPAGRHDLVPRSAAVGGRRLQRRRGDEHGSAFERISAFQFGFTDGPSACAAIDAKEMAQRRGDLPVALQRDETGEWPVSEESVQAIIDAMNILFTARQAADADASTPPSAAACPDARPSPPASFCPATNTIAVDLPGLEKLGTAAERRGHARRLLSGDNTAYSVLMSRYMLALQHQHGGLVLDNAEAGLRTACLTGVATTKLANGVSTPDGNTVALTAGDLDEAVAGLLTNGLAAGDVNGESVPAGFSRIDAFRIGVLGDQDRCLKRFP